MSRKKYINDYELDREVDDKGRIKTTARYAGGFFVFAADDASASKNKRISAVACAIAWVAFVASLIPRTAALHLIYYSLPFAFCAVPLWLLSDVTVSLFAAKPPFKHRAADKFSKRFLPCSVALAVLSGGSAVGYIAGVLTGGVTFASYDIIPAVSSLLIFGAAGALFAIRNAFETVPAKGRPDEGGEKAEDAE